MRTKKIFDTDAYVTDKTVKVLSCRQSDKKEFASLYEIITDETIFSPEGGGQCADRGFINNIKVEDVREIDGEIIHFTKEAISEGSSAEQTIDFELRKRRMQNHNAEHLICGLIHKKFGYNNVGFHLSEEFEGEKIKRIEAIMDVDGVLSAEELAEIEKEANRAIAKNVAVYALLPSSEEAKNIAYRSKLDIEENLRLVVIEGYDICACCAPCLKASGEMQLVKILDYMVHRGGMRLTLAAGEDAVNDYIALHDQNKEMMKSLSAKRYECANALEAKLSNVAKEHEEMLRIKKEITALYTKKLTDTVKESTGKFVTFFAPSLDEVQAREAVNETVGLRECVIIVFFEKSEKGYRFVAGKNEALTDISLKELAAKMRENLKAAGGGSDKMIQGNVSNTEEEIENFFK